MSNLIYKLNNVILAESHFKRNAQIENDQSIDKIININIESINADQVAFNVALHVEYVQPSSDPDNPEIEVKVKMVGLFEKEVDNQMLPQETFMNVNAPAIIFPFVREHIASITAKAGINAVFLPPVNFVDIYKQQKQAEQQQKQSPAE